MHYVSMLLASLHQRGTGTCLMWHWGCRHVMYVDMSTNMAIKKFETDNIDGVCIKLHDLEISIWYFSMIQYLRWSGNTGPLQKEIV